MRKFLPKISYMAAILLAGAISWQCNDDKVWDEPAIGSLGDLEYSMTSSGGTQILTFNTTVAWNATVNYVNGSSNVVYNFSNKRSCRRKSNYSYCSTYRILRHTSSRDCN